MRLTAASHSRLTDFEKCKRLAELKYIKRIPEPERPLPPGKTEHANDRGTRLHTGGELFVKGGVELLPELARFKDHFHHLRVLHAAGMVSLEGEWAFNKDWNSVPWMSADVFYRVKGDCVVFASQTRAIVIDYKSGKRFGNEIKHTEQMQLYALSVFLKYPKIKEVTVELWYLDLGELHKMKYTREQGLRLLPNFNKRGLELVTCETFPPNPNKFSCKWCPYKPVELGGTGHCPDGV